MSRAGNASILLLWLFSWSILSATGIATLPEWPKYEPLDLEAASFRLLVLQPGSDNEPLNASLILTDFAKKPFYHVLSHGGSSDTEARSLTITINDQSFNVSQDEWDALLWLRDSTNYVPLWINTICVNHKNLTEKKGMFQLAPTIYQRSYGVWAWTGAPPYNMTAVLDSNYWQQTSILPELLVANKIRVPAARGREYIWQILLNAAREDRPARPRPRGSETLIQLDEARQNRHSPPKTYHLSNLMRRFQDSFSQDPRDKIYQFIGIASDHLFNNMPIDHSKSLAEVYQDVIELQQQSQSDVLSKRIEMVNFAAFTRRLLTREWQYRQSLVREFSIEETGASSYLGRLWRWLRHAIFAPLGMNKNQNGSEDHERKILLSPVSWVFRIIFSLLIQPQDPFQPLQNQLRRTNRQAYWLIQGCRERFKDWLISTSTPQSISSESIQLRGRIVGRINLIGASYDSIIQDPAVEKSWTADLERRNSQRQYNGANHRLMRVLTDSGDMHGINRIVDFDSNHSDNMISTQELIPLQSSLNDSSSSVSTLNYNPWHTGSVRSSPKIFTASPPGSPPVLGLVAPGAQVHDAIVQFWNSTGAAVMRPAQAGGPWKIVGRAAVITRDDGPIDWDVIVDQQFFVQQSLAPGLLVDVNVDINVLTALSLDTMVLPGENCECV